MESNYIFSSNILMRKNGSSLKSSDITPKALYSSKTKMAKDKEVEKFTAFWYRDI